VARRGRTRRRGAARADGAAAPVRERVDFRVTNAAKANETFGAATHDEHDDLVLAIAMTAGDPNVPGKIVRLFHEGCFILAPYRTTPGRRQRASLSNTFPN
jgi:hypothetical protein